MRSPVVVGSGSAVCRRVGSKHAKAVDAQDSVALIFTRSMRQGLNNEQAREPGHLLRPGGSLSFFVSAHKK